MLWHMQIEPVVCVCSYAEEIGFKCHSCRWNAQTLTCLCGLMCVLYVPVLWFFCKRSRRYWGQSPTHFKMSKIFFINRQRRVSHLSLFIFEQWPKPSNPFTPPSDSTTHYLNPLPAAVPTLLQHSHMPTHRHSHRNSPSTRGFFFFFFPWPPSPREMNAQTRIPNSLRSWFDMWQTNGTETSYLNGADFESYVCSSDLWKQGKPEASGSGPAFVFMSVSIQPCFISLSDFLLSVYSIGAHNTL